MAPRFVEFPSLITNSSVKPDAFTSPVVRTINEPPYIVNEAFARVRVPATENRLLIPVLLVPNVDATETV